MISCRPVREDRERRTGASVREIDQFRLEGGLSVRTGNAGLVQELMAGTPGTVRFEAVLLFGIEAALPLPRIVVHHALFRAQVAAVFDVGEGLMSRNSAGLVIFENDIDRQSHPA